MRRHTRAVLTAAAALLLVTACGTVGGSADDEESDEGAQLKIEVEAGSLEDKTICFNVQTLETEFWAAADTAMSEALGRAGAEVLEFNSNEDANRQLQQIKDCITRDPDGIIFIPQDGASANTIISTANNADVPIVAFNRPPADDSGQSIVVVADNRALAKETVEYQVELAQAKVEESGEKVQPLVMVGDLADINGIDRRDGYYDAVNAHPELFEKTIEVETKWDATTARQNLQAAMQANPEVDMIFTSSDFLYPQIQSVLTPLNKWKTKDEEGHVILAGLDGDSGACNLMRDGYVDATGVQDLLFETESSISELTAAIEAEDTQPSKTVTDPGFALTQANMDDREDEMWGCVISPPK